MQVRAFERYIPLIHVYKQINFKLMAKKIIIFLRSKGWTYGLVI